jgi:hypothetical protein
MGAGNDVRLMNARRSSIDPQAFDAKAYYTQKTTNRTRRTAKTVRNALGGGTLPKLANHNNDDDDDDDDDGEMGGDPDLLNLNSCCGMNVHRRRYGRKELLIIMYMGQASRMSVRELLASVPILWRVVRAFGLTPTEVAQLYAAFSSATTRVQTPAEQQASHWSPSHSESGPPPAAAASGADASDNLLLTTGLASLLGVFDSFFLRAFVSSCGGAVDFAQFAYFVCDMGAAAPAELASRALAAYCRPLLSIDAMAAVFKRVREVALLRDVNDHSAVMASSPKAGKAWSPVVGKSSPGLMAKMTTSVVVNSIDDVVAAIGGVAVTICRATRKLLFTSRKWKYLAQRRRHLYAATIDRRPFSQPLFEALQRTLLRRPHPRNFIDPRVDAADADADADGTYNSAQPHGQSPLSSPSPASHPRQTASQAASSPILDQFKHTLKAGASGMDTDGDGGGDGEDAMPLPNAVLSSSLPLSANGVSMRRSSSQSASLDEKASAGSFASLVRASKSEHGSREFQSREHERLSQQRASREAEATAASANTRVSIYGSLTHVKGSHMEMVANVSVVRSFARVMRVLNFLRLLRPSSCLRFQVV